MDIKGLIKDGESLTSEVLNIPLGAKFVKCEVDHAGFSPSTPTKVTLWLSDDGVNWEAHCSAQDTMDPSRSDSMYIALHFEVGNINPNLQVKAEIAPVRMVRVKARLIHG